MKVLVVSHHLEIGGSQTNCIDLATALRDRLGYEIVFCATPGPARELLDSRGLRLIELPRPRSAPSPTIAARIRTAVADEAPDVVHAYEWQQILDVYFGAYLRTRVPMIGTVMSMDVQRMLPRSIPLTYGTEDLVDEATKRQRAPVTLLEPPVDTDTDAPGTADAAGFRRAYDLDDSAVTLVIVSRLISWLKAESLFRTIDAVAELDGPHRLQLVVVGGGSIESEVAARAEAVNGKLARKAVVLTGALIDPRPAYEAADIVLGMGGSILRGMSFAKPCIVLGEGGFSEILRTETTGVFVRQGLYGRGHGAPSDLAGQIATLAADSALRADLAATARNFVVERYGLGASAEKLRIAYATALSWRPAVTDRALEPIATLARRAGSVVAEPLRSVVTSRSQR